LLEKTDSKPFVRRSVLPQGPVCDGLFLVFIISLSVILYIRGLGFYSDDWAFLQFLSSSQNQSFPKVVQEFSSQAFVSRERPVQSAYYCALYWLFGLHPLGYHIVNAVVLMTGIVLFYSALRELNLNRLLALALPMVYGLLPHYSTNRFWWAAFVANLSMSLYFLSLYSDLRTLRTQPAHLWKWKSLSVAGLLGSALSYEVFLPLFFLNPFIVYHRRRELDRTGSSSPLSIRRLKVLLGSNLLLLVLLVGFKLLATIRPSGAYPNLIDQIKYIVSGSITVSYRRYGFGLPRMIWGIIHYYPDTAMFTLGGILGLTIFGYLYYVAHQSKLGLPSWTSLIKLTGLGFAVFGLAYALFFGPSCGFSPTGMENRVAIAAAVGVAFSFVGGLGLVISAFRSQKLKSVLFCILIALLSTSGFLINNTIASFWKAASRQQQEILADMREHVPTLPAGSTLLLAGTCRYDGPGVIFECFWDLTGALNVINHLHVRRADIVRPTLKITKSEISSSMGGIEYPDIYNALYIYDFDEKVIRKLTNVDSTTAYLARFTQGQGNRCPKAREGGGVPIF
jgi:hypothetical protein